MERPPLFRNYTKQHGLQENDTLVLEDDEQDEIATAVVAINEKGQPIFKWNDRVYESEKKFCEAALEAPEDGKKHKVTGGYYTRLFVIKAGVRCATTLAP